MKLRAVIGLAVVGCHGSRGGAPSATDAPPAVADAPGASDAALDAAPAPDPWTQPLGDPIAGATLADGWTDLRALPAPMLIEGGWTDSLFALPDGQHLRFAYEPIDFFDFYLATQHGMTSSTVTGPPLLGMAGTTFKVFDATLTDAGWTLAVDPVDSPDPAVVEASPATNASDDLIVWTRYAGASAKASLYYAEWAAGAWSAATAAVFNSTSCNDDNAKLVGDVDSTLSIYFESNRGDAAGTGATCGQRTLYTTTYTHATDSYTPVSTVPGITTATSDDSQPFITADQRTLYWTSQRDASYGIFTATRDAGGTFGDIHAIVTPTLAAPFAGNLTFVGEASLVVVPQGELLYLMCGVAYDEHGGDTFHDADDIRLMPCVARRPAP